MLKAVNVGGDADTVGAITAQVKGRDVFVCSLVCLFFAFVFCRLV